MYGTRGFGLRLYLRLRHVRALFLFFGPFLSIVSCLWTSFFFSLQTSLSCVFFSVSPIRTHTLSFSLSLAPPPLCQLFPLSFFPIYPPLFFPTSFETHPRLPSLHQPGQSMSFTGILLQPLLMGDWDVCPLIGW